jgi:hypothetical protein
MNRRSVLALAFLAIPALATSSAVSSRALATSTPASASASGKPASASPSASSASASPAPTTSSSSPDPTAVDAAARAKGVKWLVSAQNADGGWGAGAWGADSGQAASDVATTAVAVLALRRDGGHADAITKGVRYVAAVVEKSPNAGPELAVPQGTQPQYKLGKYVDTHMAALVLGEVAGTLDADTNRLVAIALDKAISKVQAAQRADGSFDGEGWAPVLSHSVAAMSLMKAKEKGVAIDEKALDRAEAYQARKVNTSTGAIDVSDGAGVALYEVASTMSQASGAKARGSATPLAGAEEMARGQVARDDGRLLQGFGSMGGEEMLSYMMISDSLAERGGGEWRDCDAKISRHLASIQNADGSWAGAHCITSRTFTTSVALMTLGAGGGATTAVSATKPVSGADFWSW